MAKRKDLGIIKATPSAPQGADDLAILYPNREIVIRGETIIVREYKFVEGLKLRALYEPLLDDLQELILAPNMPVSKVTLILAKHNAILVSLMAVATDREEAFINELSSVDGEQLLSVWWAVNCNFFLRQALDQIVALNQEKIARDGQTFTKPLSSTTTRQSASSTTPSAK